MSLSTRFLLQSSSMPSLLVRNQKIPNPIRKYVNRYMKFQPMQNTVTTLLQRIKQAQLQNQQIIAFPYQTTLESLLKVLKQYGRIHSYFIITNKRRELSFKHIFVKRFLLIYLLHSRGVPHKRAQNLITFSIRSYPNYYTYAQIRQLSKNNKRIFLFHGSKEGICTQIELLKNKNGGVLFGCFNT